MNDKKQFATEITEGMQWFCELGMNLPIPAYPTSLWPLCSLWFEFRICR